MRPIVGEGAGNAKAEEKLFRQRNITMPAPYSPLERRYHPTATKSNGADRLHAPKHIGAQLASPNRSEP